MAPRPRQDIKPIEERFWPLITRKGTRDWEIWVDHVEEVWKKYISYQATSIAEWKARKEFISAIQCDYTSPSPILNILIDKSIICHANHDFSSA